MFHLFAGFFLEKTSKEPVGIWWHFDFEAIGFPKSDIAKSPIHWSRCTRYPAPSLWASLLLCNQLPDQTAEFQTSGMLLGGLWSCRWWCVSVRVCLMSWDKTLQKLNGTCATKTRSCEAVFRKLLAVSLFGILWQPNCFPSDIHATTWQSWCSSTSSSPASTGRLKYSRRNLHKGKQGWKRWEWNRMKATIGSKLAAGCCAGVKVGAVAKYFIYISHWQSRKMKQISLHIIADHGQHTSMHIHMQNVQKFLWTARNYNKRWSKRTS